MIKMKPQKFGLVGFPLSHSFSKKYFTEKFQELGLAESHSYELYEMEDVNQLKDVVQNTEGLKGLNVTIPHKLNVLPLLSEVDSAAERIGAVNVIRVSEDKSLKGYNSDYYGFKRSLEEFLGGKKDIKALVLGNGGAAKAVCIGLEDSGIPYYLVSRQKAEGTITYLRANDLLEECKLIINCTPLGTHPNVNSCPDLDYEKLGNQHYMYDLVYNPSETLFLRKGKSQGAKTINGYQMLVYQAEKSWEIWNL